jgi:hypothetical protein
MFGAFAGREISEEEDDQRLTPSSFHVGALVAAKMFLCLLVLTAP